MQKVYIYMYEYKGTTLVKTTVSEVYLQTTSDLQGWLGRLKQESQSSQSLKYRKSQLKWFELQLQATLRCHSAVFCTTTLDCSQEYSQRSISWSQRSSMIFEPSQDSVSTVVYRIIRKLMYLQCWLDPGNCTHRSKRQSSVHSAKEASLSYITPSLWQLHGTAVGNKWGDLFPIVLFIDWVANYIPSTKSNYNFASWTEVSLDMTIASLASQTLFLNTYPWQPISQLLSSYSH